METKEYYKERICKFCKNNKRFCDFIETIKQENVKIYKCEHYKKDEEELNLFMYKNQIFFYWGG